MCDLLKKNELKNVNCTVFVRKYLNNIYSVICFYSMFMFIVCLKTKIKIGK